MKNLNKTKKKRIKLKLKTKRNKLRYSNKIKGGVLRTFNELYPPTTASNPVRRPRWRPGFTTIVQAPNMFLYGTSLPLWNQFDMEDIIKFYLFRKDIKRVISLQGCGSVAPPQNNLMMCQPNRLLEDETFAVEKDSFIATQNDPNVQFINIPVRDMSPGTLDQWIAISALTFTLPQETSIVHCYAGLGRTGSFILYNIMRIHGHPNLLLVPFMNQVNSAGMYNLIIVMLQTIVTSNNVHEHGTTLNTIINQFDVNVIIQEVSNIEDIFHANLLISRINLIILMLCFRANLPLNQEIYLYRLIGIAEYQAAVTAGNGINMNNIFNPIRGLYQPSTIQQIMTGLFIVP